MKHTLKKDVFPLLKEGRLYQGLSRSVKEEHCITKTPSNSYINLTIAALYKELERNFILVFHDKEEALYALNELEDIFSKQKVLFFPSTHLQPYQVEEVNNANIVLRTEVINKITSDDKNYIIITYSQALSENIITKKDFKENIFKLKKNEKLSHEFLNELLFSFNFRRVDYVTEPGEFSVRGGIIDVFSFSDENPIRINFFGDEIESIKKFDIESQLSFKALDHFELIPNLQTQDKIFARNSFFKSQDPNTLVILKDADLTLKYLEENYTTAIEIYEKNNALIKQTEPNHLFYRANQLIDDLQKFTTLEYSHNISIFKKTETIINELQAQPIFQKNFDLVANDLLDKQKNGFKIFINFNSEKQSERLQQIFIDLGKKINFTSLFSKVHSGFIDFENKWLLYTDHQIFNRYHSYSNRNQFAKSESVTLKELTQLKVGDYVTHIDHGIGRFMGLVKLNNNGNIQESIKLQYQDNALLYINIHALHKISKYSGKEGAEIKINKLGSPAWKNLKNKTKKRVKEIAYDLIKLYAERKVKKGFAFAPDSYLQTELEASFLYEDTPDQEKATLDVKADMEKPQSMDRLICGDVGFGKTEIAIRAAFKAVADGKQVAILVPTTILAYQHYNTFTKRLKDFPANVSYLNRFRSTKERSETLAKTKSGKIDILIGTHQLISKELQFKDLGLLIIDEEHKFGVAVKDKLKTLKTEVDTLTLTATPIPRTLQFSLMAARDLSIIKTPPPNRQPVTTELITLNEEKIRDAVLFEMQRGGQVFFINNRVENLKDIAGMIQRLVPEARITTGHGQMRGKDLEKNLLEFIEGKKDVLVSTTIVESGLDIPNANTIFINNAHNFGLADLHQMRGRVGRSNKKAYCYLITYPLATLSSDARKRLQAIESFSDLGSGFQIAMKDLEIRGAGDLLGGEQSGFITDIGFDAYHKILQETIEDLKLNEFETLFKDEPKVFVSEVQIETDLELLIPDDYVNDVEERLLLYQKLNEIETQENLTLFQNELIDRFGKLPKEVEGLLKTVALKNICKEKGFVRLVFKQGIALCYLPSEKSKYFESEDFHHLIRFIQTHAKKIQLKEKIIHKDKNLFLKISNVKTLDELINLLNF